MAAEKKSRSILRIYILYWIMLAYIVAALGWWFIELNRQNEKMLAVRSTVELNTGKENTPSAESLMTERKRKVAQYTGEGVTFLLLILLSAFLFFRAVRKQLKISREQQQFMIAITHELKTPIAVSTLNLETLQKRELDKDRREKLMGNTLEEMRRLNALCNNLLLSSQMESAGYLPSRETVDLNELAERCVKEFSGRFPGRNISFSGEDEKMIRGDRFLIEMALNNLLDNAVKYSTGESGIEVGVREKEGRILLEVSDGGQGIPEAEQNRIFDKFYRIGDEATRNARGTGLGLFIVKKVADMHDAFVSVSGRNPRGTLFSISLPKTV